MVKELRGGGSSSGYSVSAKERKTLKTLNFFVDSVNSRISLFAEGLGTKSRRKAKDDRNLTDKESKYM